MRDKRFIAEHRGGLLKKNQHIQFIRWAVDCAENVLTLTGKKTDKRLLHALITAEEWTRGKATTGEARKASLEAIAVANESTDPVVVAVARAVGHAAAAAHMADHSLGSAMYALKAAKVAGRSLEKEREWQNMQLSSEISELALSARDIKEKYFKI